MRSRLAGLVLALAAGSSHAQDGQQRAEIVYCDRATRELKAINEGEGRPDVEPRAVLEARVKGCITILETYRDEQARRLLEMAR